MSRRILTAVAVVASVAIGVVTLAPAASARWIIHNGSDVTEIQPPPGRTDSQTCPDKIRGRAGWFENLSPEEAEDYTIPAGSAALTPVEYVVLKAPPGRTLEGVAEVFDPDTGEPTGEYELSDGTPVPVLLIFRTAPRTALSPPVLAFPDEPIDPISNTYVVSTAPLAQPLPAGSLVPGDEIAIKPAGLATFHRLTVINCGTLPVHRPRIDIQPGHDPNDVNPSMRFPYLAAAVYGDRTLDVTKIASVKLGTAQPSHLPSPYSAFEQPMDLDHDGRLDRIYFFVPAASGITCGQRSVRLTGETDIAMRFNVSGPIRTVSCG